MRYVMTTLGMIGLIGVLAVAQSPQKRDASTNQPATAPAATTAPVDPGPGEGLARAPAGNAGAYAYIVPSDPSKPRRGGFAVIESAAGREQARPEPQAQGPTLIEPVDRQPLPEPNYGPDGGSYPSADMTAFFARVGIFPDSDGYFPLTGDKVQAMCDYGNGHPFFCPSIYIVKNLRGQVGGQ